MKSVLHHPYMKVVMVCLALGTFSLFIHHPLPFPLLSFAAITYVAFVIANDNNRFSPMMGERSSHIKMVWIIIASLASFLMAQELRHEADLPTPPATLKFFAVVAILIGIMEELVFRGWMLSQFKRSIWVGVLITAIAHASYKSILFLSPYLAHSVDPLQLFIMTFNAGLFLGLSRVMSASLWPAIIAHAIFDILVYGDQNAPWWVF